MGKIAEVEGIGPAYAAKLEAAAVSTTEGLLEKGASPGGRDELAEATGISGSLILKWVNRADLDRVKGIGPQFADLLEAAGVDSVPELAQRNAANLHVKLSEINAAKNLVNRLPALSEVEAMIEFAKGLPKIVTH